MLRAQVKEHITQLSDAELMEYALTGQRMYDPEAIQFAKEELARRKLSSQQATKLQEGIAGQLAIYDARNPWDLKNPKSHPIVCQLCGVEAPTAYAVYHQNIGALVARFERKYAGHFCRRCNHKIFWKRTLVLLFFGWWGVISFVSTLIYLPANIVGFLKSFSIPKASPGATAPTLDEKAFAKIEPHLQLVEDRLTEGMDRSDIAREVAKLAGVTPGQAYCYVTSAIQQRLEEARQAQAAAKNPVRGFPVIMNASKQPRES